MTDDREQIRREAERQVAVDHHGRCDSHHGGACDCYKRRPEYAMAEDYLALLAELEQAEQTALDWQAACEESQASESDLMKELTESKKLYEYAQSYRSETEKKLEQAERERDEARQERDIHRAAADVAEEWMVPFDGSGIEWHESLPSPYTYQACDFGKLLAATHEYESRALKAEARLAAVPALVEATKELLRDDDMPNHWDDCGCSYCTRSRAVREALAAWENTCR